MNKLSTQIKSQVVTKSGVSVGHKLALSLLIFSAFTIGLSFAGMTLSTKRSISERPIQRTSNAQPLMIDEISDASMNVMVYIDGPDPGYDPMLTFTTVNQPPGPDNLGELNLNTGDYNSNYYSGQAAPLVLYIDYGEEAALIPARIINIQTNYPPGGESDYTLCLPKTVVYPGNTAMFFYDTNGTPYFDSSLTAMATPQPCNIMLARALDIDEISDASVNVTVDSDVFNSELHFLSNFNNGTLGSLSLGDNYYNGDYNPSESGAPLAIGTYYVNDNATTIPARIINIQTNPNPSGASDYTLCFPETFVPANSSAYIYFYDLNGTPYHDSFLTEMAIPQACNVMLADALDLAQGGIYDPSVNVVVESTPGTLGPDLTFVANFNSSPTYYTDMGSLNLSTNSYYSGSGWSDPGAPLAVQLYWDDNMDRTVPARIVNVMTDDFINNYTLCLPETLVSADTGYTYFYDINGTPYHDSLLIEMATPEPCNQLLAQALDLAQGGIYDPSVNVLVAPILDNPTFLDTPNLNFVANFNSGPSNNYPDMGSLDLSTNSYFNGSGYSDSGAPLAVHLYWSDGNDATVPARIINVMTDDTPNKYTLCLPETFLEADAYYTYFYDTNGTPYHDSLLIAMATPQPCNELLAQALNMAEVTNAYVRVTVPVPPGYGSPELTFVANFNSDYSSPNYPDMGSLNLGNNNYNDNSGQSDSGAPLAVEVYWDDAINSTMPARIFNVITNHPGGGDDSQTLCLPETFLPGFTSYTYFYDNNGTPYHDSLLTDMAIPQPCNQLLIPTCIDSDPNNDVYIFGTTTGIDEHGVQYTSPDVCYGVNNEGIGTQVGQFYCYTPTPDDPFGLFSGEIISNCTNGCWAATGTCITDEDTNEEEIFY